MIATATVLSQELFGGIVLPADSRLPPFHITWHVAGAYDWDGAADTLEGIAGETPAFQVAVEGAHVFVTDRYAVVGLLRHSDALESLHRRIVDALATHARHVDQRYAGPYWVPHVTLASGLSEVEAGEVRAAFEQRETGTPLTIDNLAFLSVENGRFILSNVRRFNGSDTGKKQPAHE